MAGAMSLPLERIDVSAPEGRVAVLNEATGEWRTCPRWELRTLAPVPGYVAALAVEGQAGVSLYGIGRESRAAEGGKALGCLRVDVDAFVVLRQREVLSTRISESLFLCRVVLTFLTTALAWSAILPDLM